MIEKLEIQEIEQPTGSEYTIIERVPATSGQMHDKINELVDAVNELQERVNDHEQAFDDCAKDVTKAETMLKNINTIVGSLITDSNIHEKQIDELQMKLEPHKYEPAENGNCAKIAQGFKNLQDQYAEQRKWIGKLCWFSQLNGIWQHLAILKEIKDNGLFITDDGGLVYCKCKPVKPDDDIIYHGE